MEDKYLVEAGSFQTHG